MFFLLRENFVSFILADKGLIVSSTYIPPHKYHNSQNRPSHSFHPWRVVSSGQLELVFPWNQTWRTCCYHTSYRYFQFLWHALTVWYTHSFFLLSLWFTSILSCPYFSPSSCCTALISPCLRAHLRYPHGDKS